MSENNNPPFSSDGGGEAERWLAQAREDLQSAEILRAGGRFYLVCFLSQQIAEKALKAFLYAQGRDVVFGHSVAKLCDTCSAYNARFQHVKKEIKNLDQYYIEARYPNGLPEGVPAEFFNEDDAAWALNMAQRALEVVGELIRTSPG